MHPEDRATAERLWGFYTQQAQAQLLAMGGNPPLIPFDMLMISPATLLRLSADREYWRGRAVADADPATLTPAMAEVPATAAAVLVAPSAEAPAAATKAAKPKAKPPAQQTPERLDLLKVLWADARLSTPQVMARLNALAGPTIINSTNLYGWAQKLGLPGRRPLPPEASVMPATSTPTPAAPQAAPQAGAAQRVPITKRDVWEEAADLLAAGMSVVEVATEMDLPKGKVSDLKFKILRERQDAAQAQRSA